MRHKTGARHGSTEKAGLWTLEVTASRSKNKHVEWHRVGLHEGSRGACHKQAASSFTDFKCLSEESSGRRPSKIVSLPIGHSLPNFLIMTFGLVSASPEHRQVHPAGLHLLIPWQSPEALPVPGPPAAPFNHCFGTRRRL